MMLVLLIAVFPVALCMGHAAVHGTPDMEGVGKNAAPISLLHRSVLKQSVSTHSHASQTTRDLISNLGLGKRRSPSNRQHMLTDSELNSTETIGCLQAKQRDPRINCTFGQYGLFNTWAGGDEELNAGNYPSPNDPMCHNPTESTTHENFCDPENNLNYEETADLIKFMQEQRASQYVTCGPQVQHDPVDKWNYQPFYLGVAIADSWPLQESDADSLQQFGRILAGRWNMTFPWDGNPGFYARCPNEAMLIVLPKYGQAFLSSSSCMWLCPTKGGPEVATATIGMMNRKGLLAGLKAGVQQVYNVLKQTTPMHPRGWEPVEKTAGTWGGIPYGQAPPPQDSQLYAGDSFGAWVWNWVQRFLFIIACIALAGSVALAILVCYMAPGLEKDLNKSVV